MTAIAIVLAAGSGERLGVGRPKAFLPIGERPLLLISVMNALASDAVSAAVATVPAGLTDRAREVLASVGDVEVVPGGQTRQASVRAALAAVPARAPVIVCHDAARPFARPELFSAVVEALADADGAVPVVPVPDTVKRLRDGFVEATEPREALGLAQTPQAFAAPALRDAHARAERAGLVLTDDAALLEWAGYRVRAIPGDPANFKITTPEDLARAEAMAIGGARG